MLKTPVLLLAFKRPHHIKRILAAIRQAQPQKLFVAADGPREEVPGEAQACQKVREEIASAIDWQCDVRTLYREKNLGCKLAVSSAIDWFFSENQEGIILEDDTLPQPQFFDFSEYLLNKYREEKKVMHISGDNFQDGRIRGSGAFYFSRFAHSWGWATWHRAWQHYNVNLEGFTEDWPMVEKLHQDLPEWAAFWKPIFLQTLNGEVNTWDYQWHYTICKQGGHCAIPNLSMVSNIGTGIDATHTSQQSFMTSIPARNLYLRESPSKIAYDNAADLFDFSNAAAGKWPARKSLKESFHFLHFLLRNWRKRIHIPTSC